MTSIADVAGFEDAYTDTFTGDEDADDALWSSTFLGGLIGVSLLAAEIHPLIGGVVFVLGLLVGLATGCTSEEQEPYDPTDKITPPKETPSGGGVTNPPETPTPTPTAGSGVDEGKSWYANTQKYDKSGNLIKGYINEQSVIKGTLSVTSGKPTEIKIDLPIPTYIKKEDLVAIDWHRIANQYLRRMKHNEWGMFRFAIHPIQ